MISDKAKIMAAHCFGWLMGAIGFLGLLVILSILSGCTQHQTSPQSDIEAVEQACFSGGVHSYQHIKRDEKVAFVCK